MESKKQTPSEFLKQIIGRPVVVKLNSGVDYRGERNYIIIQKNLSFYNVCIVTGIAYGLKHVIIRFQWPYTFRHIARILSMV